jgi:2-succinyl-6-hydroxy-2,4-cyclohexadiene-1-carboxylate synthase
VPESLVLLHGFGGTRHAWDRVVAQLRPESYLPVALDLPGHGDAAEPRGPITFDSCVAEVLAQSPQRFALCGYSLGGRIALQVALAAPERVRRLVLVSSSAGIEDPDERARRRSADAAFAEQLEQRGLEDFIARWREQPLFAGDPPAVARRAAEEQRRNRPAALAAALRGVGAGKMAPLWGRLAELTMPVRVLVGSRDERYHTIGRRMVGLLPAAELIVLPGGHRLPLESPRELAELVAP